MLPTTRNATNNEECYQHERYQHGNATNNDYQQLFELANDAIGERPITIIED
jgi:hypothetical protein